MTRAREGAGIPAPLLVPAALGIAFLVLPVVGLLVLRRQARESAAAG